MCQIYRRFGIEGSNPRELAKKDETALYPDEPFGWIQRCVKGQRMPKAFRKTHHCLSSSMPCFFDGFMAFGLATSALALVFQHLRTQHRSREHTSTRNPQPPEIL